MAAFQKDLASFEAAGAQVLGVSPDPIETHQRFAKELGLTFPLLADPGRAITAAYGSGRVTYVIDRAGVIRHVEEGVPDHDRLLRALRDLP